MPNYISLYTKLYHGLPNALFGARNTTIFLPSRPKSNFCPSGM